MKNQIKSLFLICLAIIIAGGIGLLVNNAHNWRTLSDYEDTTHALPEEVGEILADDTIINSVEYHVANSDFCQDEWDALYEEMKRQWEILTADPSTRVPHRLEILDFTEVLEYVPGARNWSLASAKLHYECGISETVSSVVRWRSKDDNVLSTQGGHFFNITGVGTTTLVASYRGLTAEREVAVLTGIIERLEISPSDVEFIFKRTDDGDEILSWPMGFMGITGFTREGTRLDLFDDESGTTSELITFQLVNPDVIPWARIFRYAEIVNSADIVGIENTAEENILIATVPSTASNTGIVYTTLRLIPHNIEDVERIEIELEVYTDSMRHYENLVYHNAFITAYAILYNGIKIDIRPVRVVEWEISNREILDFRAATVWLPGFKVIPTPGQSTITASFAGFTHSVTINITEGEDGMDITTTPGESTRPTPTCPPVHAGTLTTAPWQICECGVLRISQGDINWTTIQHSPWHNYHNNIRQVVIEGPLTAGTSIRSLFAGLSNVTTITGLELIDTAAVTTMANLFDGTASLTTIAGLTNWDTSNVTTTYAMFRGSGITSLDLSAWNMSGVTSMARMFQNAENLTTTGDISNWNTAQVTQMRYMFQNTAISQLDLSRWNTANVTVMQNMFHGAANLTYLGDISNWDVAQVTNMYALFRGTGITSLDLSRWNVGNVTRLARMFQDMQYLTTVGDLSSWDTRNTTDMRFIFQGASSIVAVDLSGWHTGNVTVMNDMFHHANSLTCVGDLSRWDVSQATHLHGMFRHTRVTDLDLSNWCLTSAVNIRQMFQHATELTRLDISGWDTSHMPADSMGHIFGGASGLRELHIGPGFTFLNVTELRNGTWRNAEGNTLTTPELISYQNTYSSGGVWVLE